MNPAMNPATNPVVNPRVEEFTRRLAETGDLPAFVTDLADLAGHVAAARRGLAGIELHYAAKANPEPPVLQAVAPHVDGVEVASRGEFEHVRRHLPGMPLAFGGPVKTADTLRAVLGAGPAAGPDAGPGAGVDLVHVESVAELAGLARLTDATRQPVDVLLRVNPALPVAAHLAGRAALVMGGTPSPFGLDPDAADACAALLATPGAARVRFRGLHLHLASGLWPADHLALAGAALAWCLAWAGRHRLPLEIVNLGGGMAVDYADPQRRFDWAAEGAGLRALAPPGVRLRLEPGRALAAYAGFYAARVVDVRRSHGEWFAVIDGGTHHLRTPAARGHDQPLHVVPLGPPDAPPSGPGPLTVAGALCTPRDVLARFPGGLAVRAGDVALFGMAGAYGWNISHHDFLMHAPPSFHYLPAC